MGLCRASKDKDLPPLWSTPVELHGEAVTAEKLEALRSAGKQRGATCQQLLAQKLTLQNLIGRFEIYGIRPE